jgi:hypothetical protein
MTTTAMCAAKGPVSSLVWRQVGPSDTAPSALTSNQKTTQRKTRLQDKLAYQASNSLGNN